MPSCRSPDDSSVCRVISALRNHSTTTLDTIQRTLAADMSVQGYNQAGFFTLSNLRGCVGCLLKAAPPGISELRAASIGAGVVVDFSSTSHQFLRLLW